jgi:diacylglycerol kinase family enzyme
MFLLGSRFGEKPNVETAAGGEAMPSVVGRCPPPADGVDHEWRCTMTGTTHLLVANAAAQSGRNAAHIQHALTWLASHGVACEVFTTLAGGGTIDAVTRALDTSAVHIVIAMGGDGTFREVAAGLLASTRREEVALGMLPTGTANDQGRSFGLDAGEAALEPNLAVILAGHETRLDAGRIRALNLMGAILAESVFFDSAGWGISARVLAARNADRHVVESIDVLRDVYRDNLVYAGAFIRTFLESYVASDTFEALISADGVQHELLGLTDLVVKGTRVYAGSWVFDRTSAHDDGLFEVVPFQGKLDWASKAILGLDATPLTEDILSTLGIEHSRDFRAAKLAIAFTRPADVPHVAQIDGEEWVASDRVEIDVVRQALRLVVPAFTGAVNSGSA